MLSNFRTPEKPLQLFNEDISSTVKRDPNQIFSTSASRSRRSCRSERRYTPKSPKVFDKVTPYNEDSEQEARPNKFLTFEEPNTKQKSIGDCEETTKLTVRKEASTRDTSKFSMYTEESRSPVPGQISDDSVIHIAVNKAENLENKKNSHESVGKSLQALDSTPCALFCRYCKLDVHSSIEYYNTRMSGGFLKIVSSIFTCCSGPFWLNNMKVHKCPNCSLVLAKCR